MDIDLALKTWRRRGSVSLMCLMSKGDDQFHSKNLCLFVAISSLLSTTESMASARPQLTTQQKAREALTYIVDLFDKNFHVNKLIDSEVLPELAKFVGNQIAKCRSVTDVAGIVKTLIGQIKKNTKFSDYFDVNKFAKYTNCQIDDLRVQIDTRKSQQH